MNLETEPATSLGSPLPEGEVGLRSNPGEGLRPIDKPYPRTATLSRSKSDISDFDNLRVEREFTSGVAVLKRALQLKGLAL